MQHACYHRTCNNSTHFNSNTVQVKKLNQDSRFFMSHAGSCVALISDKTQYWYCRSHGLKNIRAAALYKNTSPKLFSSNAIVDVQDRKYLQGIKKANEVFGWVIFYKNDCISSDNMIFCISKHSRILISRMCLIWSEDTS